MLGGGIPEFSFNLIAGGPGGGKTTLAHQIMFATATRERPALYITILGEPPIKMLRYQQQFSFFDATKIAVCVRFLHLGAELHRARAREGVGARSSRKSRSTNPKLVFVDSFRAVVRKSMEPGQMELQSFVQRLALHLTGWEATTFLIGEYEEREAECNPIFTVADGIVWLSQATSRNSIVRKVQVVKMRGQGQIPGLHTMKISDAGLRVYPRLPNPDRPSRACQRDHRNATTGVEALDDDARRRDSGRLLGHDRRSRPGSGKTILSTQFIREGIAAGRARVIAVFEKRPDEYLTTAPTADELQRARRRRASSRCSICVRSTSRSTRRWRRSRPR